VVGILVLLVAVVVLMKAIPVRIAVAELKDYAVKQAESASLPRHSDDFIRGQVLRKAQEQKLPLGEQQLEVSRDSAQVRIEYHFMVPIDFPFYTYEWHVRERIERVLF